ncbi:hypothetical protein SAMD00019534_108200 [Acytostelium subglobosum LB1]|uniref:hypothetical protein n=1 Tax=Acytostelium subglobosum LB1 TaxID=1410327 RepID=UPI000645004F|nr:hypothetical protein SAMD00019534_108200 [Acytostelium subglobosum LB1]GAM27644.1 hypothetical protein SAMD00019534_108200 [Acytostelium subglobosum LB1]|eukprot:XP_012749303.1 hypothetical protein SAMD00019534_108200 [Acytostelium subglobosum LB1]
MYFKYLFDDDCTEISSPLNLNYYRHYVNRQKSKELQEQRHQLQQQQQQKNQLPQPQQQHPPHTSTNSENPDSTTPSTSSSTQQQQDTQQQPDASNSLKTSQESTTSGCFSGAPDAAGYCQNPLYYCYDNRMMFSIFLMEFPYNIDTDAYIMKEYDRLRTMQEQTQGAPRHTEILLRKEDSIGGRKALKEKFVEIYEAFFAGDDPSKDQQSFWEQLFLIKVNAPFLERCLNLVSDDHLQHLRPNINLIFTQCCQAIKHSDSTRISHILETLYTILKCIFKRKFNNFGCDIKSLLCGPTDTADAVLRELIVDLESLLCYTEVKIRTMAVELIYIMVTSYEYLNQNSLLNYFMLVDIFPSILNAVIDRELPKQTRFNALATLIYLCNFQKYDVSNIYIKQLAGLCDVDRLRRLIDVISVGLYEQNRYYAELLREPNQTLVSKFSGYLSNWILPQSPLDTSVPSNTGPCLLMLYELINFNETFVNQLVTGRLSLLNNTCPEVIKQFLTYSSYLASDNSSKESRSMLTKLSLNILICMSERLDIEDYFHDVKTSSYIFIYSKRNPYPDHFEIEKRPISCYIIDVINQFIKCNLKGGRPPTDLFQKCIDCLKRIISYKKKTQSRLPYCWFDIWTTLFSLMSTLSISDKDQQQELLNVGINTINIFNLFIAYGDLFLPEPSDYDDLFYEIIRSGQIINGFSASVELEDPNGHLANALLNIKTIITHFNSRIQQWTIEHPEFPLTSEHVIKLIRDNYETLRLKLQDNLDQYERYVENGKESIFFRQLIRYLVHDTKQPAN